MRIHFMVNATGKIVEKIIPSYYEAQKFLNRLKYSKKCTLIAYGKLI